MSDFKTFNFTQQQQNIIGNALLEFAEIYSWDNRSPRELGQSGISELFEDFVGEADPEEIQPRKYAEHSNTVRFLRALLDGVFDPRVMPAICAAAEESSQLNEKLRMVA